MTFAAGTLVHAREWGALPESEEDFLVVRLGGTVQETAGIHFALMLINE